MTPLETYRSDVTNEGYTIDRRNGLFLMYDILGYKDYIKHQDRIDLELKMMEILDEFTSIEKIDVGINLYEDNKTVQNKIKNKGIKKYLIKALMISDTVFIYPKIEYDGKPFDEEVLLISSVAKALFIHMLNEHHFLIRGSINHGEYSVIENENHSNKIIIGKGYIESYELESLQNWGGILISPKIINKINNKNVLILFEEYRIMPINKNRYKYYERIFDSNHPYVLNWPAIIEEVDWKSLYQRLNYINDSEVRESAKNKIDNSKEFYEIMRSKMQTNT